MKRTMTIMTITIILIGISTVANAQIRRSGPRTTRRPQQVVVRRMPSSCNHYGPHSSHMRNCNYYDPHSSRRYRHNSTARKVAAIGEAITTVARAVSIINGDRDYRRNRIAIGGTIATRDFSVSVMVGR